MNELDAFAARVRKRLDATQAVRVRQEVEVDLAAVTEPIHRTLIRPMLERLAGQFDNAAVHHLRLPKGFATYCRFACTEHFPATAKLSIGIEWDQDGRHAWLVSSRDIVPVLTPFDGTDRLQVAPSAPNKAAIRAWLEDRIVKFVDAYLEVERDPHYRNGHLRTDPVCGMHVWPSAGVHVVEHGGTSFYFCSAACRERFQEGPDVYLRRGKADPAAGAAANGRRRK